MDAPAKLRPADLAQTAERTGNKVELPLTNRVRLGDLIRETAAQANAHHLGAFAGNLAFRSLLTIIPSLVALLWALTALHAAGLADTLLELAETALPGSAIEPIRTQVTNAPREQASGALNFGAILSCLVALWALAGTFLATMQAMNVIYAVEERRPLWRRYLTALLLSFAITALLIGALLLTVFGERIALRFADAADLGPLFRWAWVIVTWPVMAAGVLTAFALAYYFAPDCKQRFRWVSKGTILAVVLWLLFTALFSAYVNTFATYTVTYGALAGIVLFMLYLYCNSFILLLGAEINQVIETHDPAGKQTGERQPREATGNRQQATGNRG